MTTTTLARMMETLRKDDPVDKAMLADALEDVGRTEEATLLRSGEGLIASDFTIVKNSWLRRLGVVRPWPGNSRDIVAIDFEGSDEHWIRHLAQGETPREAFMQLDATDDLLFQAGSYGIAVIRQERVEETFTVVVDVLDSRGSRSFDMRNSHGGYHDAWTVIEPETFTASVSYANGGGGYELVENVDLKADTLEKAIEEVRGFTFAEDGEGNYDVLVTIEDSEGDTVHRESFEWSRNRDAQENMDETWSEKGNYETEWVGVRDGEWFGWTTNGGREGAHDRRDGSGRWVEDWMEPEPIDAGEALSRLMRIEYLDVDETLDLMEEHSKTKAELIRKIGREIWVLPGSYGLTGVWRIKGTLRGTDGSEVVEFNDEDDALEFVEGFLQEKPEEELSKIGKKLK